MPATIFPFIKKETGGGGGGGITPDIIIDVGNSSQPIKYKLLLFVSNPDLQSSNDQFFINTGSDEVFRVFAGVEISGYYVLDGVENDWYIDRPEAHYACIQLNIKSSVEASIQFANPSGTNSKYCVINLNTGLITGTNSLLLTESSYMFDNNTIPILCFIE